MGYFFSTIKLKSDVDVTDTINDPSLPSPNVVGTTTYSSSAPKHAARGNEGRKEGRMEWKRKVTTIKKYFKFRIFGEEVASQSREKKREEILKMTHTYTHTHTFTQNTYTDTHTYTHTHTLLTHTHARTHTLLHTPIYDIHIHIHAHTRTHTHTST